MSGNQVLEGTGSHIERDIILPLPLSYQPDLISPVLPVGTLPSQLNLLSIQSPLEILLMP